MSNNYYEILGIDQTADTKTIRQAYLKLSLKHHPDKNPTDIEESKNRFIEIGQAHDTLIDPSQRAIYDQRLASGLGGSGGGNDGSGGGYDGQKTYATHRDRYDDYVTGMSEEQLASISGKVTAAAGVVGGLLGSIIGKNKANTAAGTNTTSRGGSSAASGMMGKAGSLMGSTTASTMAGNGIKTLHRRAVERVTYKKECQRAVEMGESMPTPPDSAAPTDWAAMFKQVKYMATGGGEGDKDGGMDERTDFNTSGTGNRGMDDRNDSNTRGTSTTQQQTEQEGTSTMGKIWEKAQPAVKAAMAAHAAKSNGGQNNGNNNNSSSTSPNNNNNQDSSSGGGLADLWKQAAPILQAAQTHLRNSSK